MDINKVQPGIQNAQKLLPQQILLCNFQIKDMNHVVHKCSLLLLELVFFVRMATSAEEHQPSAPIIIVAGSSFPLFQTATTTFQ